ncbi:hypothetical protein LEMLEM_LOCUS26181, partial [Lemmus lemmus]
MTPALALDKREGLTQATSTILCRGRAHTPSLLSLCELLMMLTNKRAVKQATLQLRLKPESTAATALLTAALQAATLLCCERGFFP